MQDTRTFRRPPRQRRRAPSMQDRTADLMDSLSASVADGLGRLLDAIDQSSRTRSRPCPNCGSWSDCDCHRHFDDCCDDPHCKGECRDDPCHCQCCVTDADLLVQARLGELRVVPVVVANERRRERDITLELSSFTTRGGKPAPVTGIIVGEAGYTLAACAEQAITIAIAIREPQGDQVKDGAGLAGAVVEPRVPLPDVDDCTVAYADLRIQGCDVRPVRIAVAVLPRDCGAYEVHCACGCC
jgi:hypothetical protein